MRLLGLVLIVAGLVSSAFAGTPVTVPEIDATSAVAGITVVGGALLVLRARRKR